MSKNRFFYFAAGILAGVLLVFAWTSLRTAWNRGVIFCSSSERTQFCLVAERTGVIDGWNLFLEAYDMDHRLRAKSDLISIDQLSDVDAANLKSIEWDPFTSSAVISLKSGEALKVPMVLGVEASYGFFER